MINLRNLTGTALVLAALLAACGVQNVPIDAELSVEDVAVVYDGQPQMPEITFDPPGAEIGAEVVVTPEGGAPLPAGTWPTDVGVYAVEVRASADVGGREVAGTLTILPRPIDVVPSAGQGKPFGAPDPVLAYAFLDPAGDGIVPASASGALGREDGEALGTYAITLGDLDAGANFALALAEDAPSFAITTSELGEGGVVVTSATVVFDGAPHAVAVAFDPPAAGVGATVTYGDLEPGALPVDAGTYAVTATAGPGYVGSASGTLTIAAATVTVTPTAGQGKTYGAADPALGYSASGLFGSDVVTGDLARVAGEDVGVYAFDLGTLDAGSNYVLVLAQDAPTFAILAADLDGDAIAVASASVVYDGTGRSASVTFDPPEAAVGAVVTYGDLAPGELPVDVGVYAVSVQAGPGYVGSASGTLTITPATVTVVPAADQGKVYGDADPDLGFTPSGLFGSDAVNGELARAAGETVGAYAFDVDGLDAGGNYVVVLAADAPTFAIAPRPLVLSGFAVDGKTYDGSTAATGGTFSDDRLDGDALTVDFAVAFDSADAGVAVSATFSGFALSGADAGNYGLATTTGSATAAIAPRALSVTDVLWADKVYDGGTGATASATLVTSDVVAGDDVALATQLVGAFGSSGVGTHAVVGSFALVGADAANYVVDPQPTGTAAIDPRPVELLDAALTPKTFDGATTAEVTGTLQPASVFARGVLPADVAELGYAATFAQADASADPVAVTVALTGAAAGNYVLDPVPSLSGAIAPAQVSVTPAADQAKTYGDADPVSFAYTTQGLVGDDAIAGALDRTAGESVGSYPFGLGTLDAGPNYALVLADAAPAFSIGARPITLTALQTSAVYGEGADLTAALADGSTLRDGDVLAGALARPALGVGAHDFELGTATLTRDSVDVSGNYDVTFAGYAITARPLTITADDAAKTYGDALDLGTAAFTVAASDVGTGLAHAEQVTAVALVSEGAAATAPVAAGPYAIVASDAVGSDGFDPANYAITYVDGTLMVGARTLTIGGSFTTATTAYDGTTDAGAVDASELFLIGVANGDEVALAPVAAFDTAAVGDAKVATLTEASSLTGADAGNYALSLDGAPAGTGTVVKATVGFGITIAGTDVQTEVVYDGDRTFQPNVTTDPEPVPANAPVGYYVEITYDRTGASVGSFNPVGTYTVTVTADDARYEGSSTQVIEVLARPITIASSTTRQTYGDPAGAMLPSLASGTFGRNEGFVLDGQLGFDAGEQLDPVAVGTYPIVRASVEIVRGATVVTSNYAITFASDYTVEPRPVAIAPHAEQGKVYGDADPEPLGFEATNLIGDDGVDGALARDAGEDVGAYAFTLGTLDAGANYALELVEPAATFAIAPRALTLTAAAPAYVYGDADLDLTALLADGSTLRDGDLLAGALALSATNAGTHAFALGTATLTRDDADVAANYAVAFADYTIEPRPATVTPAADQAKTYGDDDAALGYVADLLDGDALSGALAREPGEDVGTYAFDLGTLAHPDYVLDLAADAPSFAITARPITLLATEARKDYSLADPDLSPVLADGSTLGDGDALTGALAHDGTTVGTYPLSIGSARILRGEADVAANYAVTLGSFTIDPLPVAFDVINPDFLLGEGAERVHGFYGDGSEPIRGLEVAVAPDGATPSFRFTYRWTHDADHVAFSSPVTVQRIQGLGTYEVTITATAANPNYVGATTLTVWVTDAVGVAFAQDAYESLVGATTTTQVFLVDAAGAPRAAGPAPIVVDLSSDAATAAFAVGEGFASSTRATFAAGATGADVTVRAAALGAAPANLTATLVGATGAALADGAATFLSTAVLAFAPDTVQIGADALSSAVVLRLVGFEGQPVAAPSDLAFELASDPTGLTFRDADDTVDLTTATIAAGASEAGTRLLGATPGTFTATATPSGAIDGVATGELAVTITPKPAVAAVAPATAAKAQTLDLVLTGTGFAPGATVAFSGDDVTVDSVAVDGPTQLTVRVTLSSSTDTGSRAVTVANADGGTSTTEGALTLTVPTLTANDDGPYGVVEGGNRALSIASDLLANDAWSGSTTWGFDAVVSATGVTYGVAGDVLTVSAPADTGGSTASLTYRIRDAAFGTTATATVAIDVTLAPIDAILFTDPLEFEDFRTTEYSVPTFADVFASWPRFDGASYFTSAPYSANAGAWYLDGGTVVQPNNVSPGVGFVSPEGFEYFTFESTLYAGGFDNDSIGLVAAFGRPDGSNVGLVAHRTTGGNAPYDGWGLSLLQGSSYQVLAEPTVDAFTASGDWQGRASRVKVERIGDIVRIQATDWFYTNVATATPAYDPQSLIVLDLATGVVTYRSGSSFVDVTLASTQRAAVAQLQGPQSYGYYTYSQPDSRYYNTVFEGGAAADTAILLTGFDAGTGAYTGSQVWRFTEGWAQVAGRTIQQELGAPRDVTSVAKPNPGSAYPGGYAAFGDRFRIESTTVVPIVD